MTLVNPDIEELCHSKQAECSHYKLLT